MIKGYLDSKDALINFINTKTRPAVVGSATRDGTLYQEIPFPGYESVSAQRTHSAQRIQITAKHIDFAGKTVLDIGCNIGYFCFEFARRGATCWGIDYDADSLFVAESLKRIHRVDNVHFVQGNFSEEMIDELLERADHFDIILLYSTVHWLIHHLGSTRRVINMLNRLVSPRKQCIVYEPSSSNSAYYPEELTSANINEFLVGLGVDRCQRIGTFVSSNIGKRREIWLGERDVYGAVRELDSILGDGLDRKKLAKHRVSLHHTKRDKVCLKWKSWFIKTVQSRGSLYNCLLRNELRIARRLTRYPEYTPLLIAGLEFNGRMYILYENLKGTCLRDTFVRRRDVDWISRELLRFLDLLKFLGVVHNDLKPQNVILVKGSKEIRIVDYELSGPGILAEVRNETWRLLFRPQTLEEERFLIDQVALVGGDYRSPFGPGYHENDRYAVNKIIGLLKNRRRYRRERYLHFRSRFIQIVKRFKVARLILKVRTGLLQHSH